MRKKIVIVGGGSNAWAPTLVKDIMLVEGLGPLEIVLYDINKKASDLTKIFLDKLNKELQVDCVIKSTNQRASAFNNADYFIIIISTGGLASMAHDLAIPEKYSIYHTVGDTSGPGGWARTLRNFKVFTDMADAINRYAPGAVVLNYTNPMVTLTKVLAELCEGPVVGLCHGLFENIEVIQTRYKLKSEKDIDLQYAGLNHFFWITQAKAGNVNVLEDVKRRLKRKKLKYILPVNAADLMGFSSGREVGDELFRLTGVMPYIGDRHTCEYFPWYITNRATMKKYGLARTTIADRKRLFRLRQSELLKMIKGKIPASYFERSREAAADILAAHAMGKTFIDVGNFPNTGQISNLPMGTVVETAVRVDRNGFTPLTFGDLPEPVLGFVEPWTRVYDMTVEACFEKSKKLAIQALRLDPVCSHLTTPKVQEMAERLFKAHKKYSNRSQKFNFFKKI
jgi:alpha-galactosidase/6-phospho-beta-glucosidase family protein